VKPYLASMMNDVRLASIHVGRRNAKAAEHQSVAQKDGDIQRMLTKLGRGGLILALVFLSLLGYTKPAHASNLPLIVYTQYTCTSLWSQPSVGSTYIADLIGGTGLHVTGATGDGNWYQVQFLGVVPAWIATSAVDVQPPAYKGTDGGCPFPGMVPMKLHPIDSAPGPYAMTASGTVTQPSVLRASPSVTAQATTSVDSGIRAQTEQWVGDENGDIWYLVHAGGGYGWLWAYSLKLDAPDPATHAVNGKPVWSAASGKGMWFTNYFTRHTDVQALVDAAKAAGITHIYPEVAISRDGGFYGSTALDRLLPVAHAAGITVLAWVYPYLDNVAADIAMTKDVLDYRTPNGDKVDGISADIEERTDAAPVYAYGQVLRQMVGPDMPLVVTTYNPRARSTYPFPEVAASFNVIAPQDYWHSDRTTTFTGGDAQALLMVSVATIRAQLGNKDFPIEELGQMYDMFTDDGSPGGTEPTGPEITADMLAAKGFGCIGVSYFEWQTASPAQLDAFNAFKW